MLKRLTPAEQIAVLLDQYSAAVRDAFLFAIADIKSRVVLQAIVDKLVQQDIEGAIRALGIEAPAFNTVLDEVARAYSGGGNSTVGALPSVIGPDGYRLALRFDVRDPVAEQWLRMHSSSLVTGIVSDQLTAVRETIAQGMERLRHPRSIALDLVGRKGVTGERVGGIIGLTAARARSVMNYRNALEAGDSTALDAALRDKRFDKTLRVAIDAGKPIPQSTISRAVTAYESRALKQRGETIGRTETAAAVSASAEEAMRQNIAKGYIAAELVDQNWHTNMDGRERASHGAMNGQVVGWGQSFTSGAGNQLRYPGDPMAPASEIVNCRCVRTFTIRKRPKVIH